MQSLSNCELADMVYVYGYCDGNASKAKTEYQIRFPNRIQPSRKSFSNIFRKLRTGTFARKQERVRRSSRDEDVMDLVEANPSISTRRAATQIGVSKNYAWRVMKNAGIHPYHFQKVQALKEIDYASRITFCDWVIRSYEQDPRLLNQILYTDEAMFTREGIFNSRNNHYWSKENPHIIRQHAFQERIAVNVWAGMIGNQLIGPYFLPGRLDSELYLDFLLNRLFDLLDDVNLADLRLIHFQHDGAPPHFARSVREHLNETFGQRWIGRNGPIKWPPRSPDLTPLDFYLWGVCKDMVYKTPVHTREDLMNGINNAFEILKNNPNQIRSATRAVLKRCRMCRSHNGHHFEQFL